MSDSEETIPDAVAKTMEVSQRAVAQGWLRENAVAIRRPAYGPPEIVFTHAAFQDIVTKLCEVHDGR